MPPGKNKTVTQRRGSWETYTAVGRIKKLCGHLVVSMGVGVGVGWVSLIAKLI